MPILDVMPIDPTVDGRQSVTALAVRRGVVRFLEADGHAVVAELPLRSGRRADIVSLDRKGRFTIIEIKSSVADFRADGKWPEYLEFCDRFLFATHPTVPSEIFPQAEGLMLADQYGAEIVRDFIERPMVAASRKAMTLRFARAAAQRLERVLQHHEAIGSTIAGLTDFDGN